MYFNRATIEDEALLGGYKNKFNSPLIDRTGVYNDGHLIVSPIPSGTTNLSFEGCMNARAIDLLKKASMNGRDLRISYSGGIDSTSALTALLRHRDMYPEVRIWVVMTESSYNEYPEFYENHVKMKTRVLWVDELEVYNALTQPDEKPYYLVTGEIGDQLFGSALMFRKAFKDKLGLRYTAPDFHKLLDLCPNPEYTWGQALWWINFTLKYQWVQIRMYAQFNGKVDFSDIYHFFDTPEFQMWSMQTPMSVKFEDYSKPWTYKMPAKKYIYDFAGDLWYYKTKEKKPSLCNTVERGISKDLSRVTEDFRIYKLRTVEYEVI